MSVDTYMKGKNTDGYARVAQNDVEVLIAPTMARWSQTVRLATKGRFRRGFDVSVEHEHGPACRH